ncbi:MAG: epimerase [Candidatus Binatia bacterium]|nr:MAG: epimerase [Candidatus Binatia bacterium]
MRKILVTGGAGYVGSHLVRKLLDRGVHVRVLESFLYGNRGLEGIPETPRLEVLRGDICRTADLRRALEGCEAAVALAALVGDAACDFDPVYTMEVNFEATKRLLAVCRELGVRRIVFASSCSVYGANGDHLLDEESPLNPVSLYARTRILSERFLAENRGPVDVVVLRLATVCGVSPRMRFDLMVNTMTARAVVEGHVRIFGPKQWRPHVHVQDAAEAFARAVEAPRVGFRVYNVGSDGQNFTVEEVARKVATLVPGIRLETVPSRNDPRSYRVRFERIRRELGFEAQRTVDDAILEVRHLLSNGHEIDYREPEFHNAAALRLKGTKYAAYPEALPGR